MSLLMKCRTEASSLSGLWKPYIVHICLLRTFVVPDWRISVFLGNIPAFTNTSRSHYSMFWDPTSTLFFFGGEGRRDKSSTSQIFLMSAFWYSISLYSSHSHYLYHSSKMLEAEVLVLFFFFNSYQEFKN